MRQTHKTQSGIENLATEPFLTHPQRAGRLPHPSPVCPHRTFAAARSVHPATALLGPHPELESPFGPLENPPRRFSKRRLSVDEKCSPAALPVLVHRGDRQHRVALSRVLRFAGSCSSRHTPAELFGIEKVHPSRRRIPLWLLYCCRQFGHSGLHNRRTAPGQPRTRRRTGRP